MRRYLLDTGIAGDFINRRAGVYDRARQAVADGHRIGIGMPVLAELHYGVEFSATAERNRILLRRSLGDLILWPFTEEAAEIYGRLRAELRRAGVVIQQVDLMVASIALTVKHGIVVSGDRDLQRVPGLTVENWVV
jgi:tRNA(fMet)-specific endonuclease VapC